MSGSLPLRYVEKGMEAQNKIKNQDIEMYSKLQACKLVDGCPPYSHLDLTL